MWSDAYRTPRSVWAVSAIAATALHAGGAWWAITYWQTRRSTTTPPPISVIALPIADVTRSPQQPISSLPPVSPTSQADPAEAVPAAPQFEAVPDTSVPQASTPTAPETPNTVAAPTPPPSQPRPPASSDPPNTPASPSRPPSQPRPPAPQNPETSPAAPATDEVSPNQRGVLAALTLDPVPVQYRADPPDDFPQMPSGWEQTASALIEESRCFTGSIPPLITLQLTVEMDGQISNIKSWQNSNYPIDDDLVNCLDTLKTQLPPLIPAMTTGSPMPTDMVLLTLELSVTE